MPCLTSAQEVTGPAYRQAVLAIQSRIGAGDLAGAQESITTARQRFPGNGGIDNLQGVVAVQLGNETLARSSFESAVRHSPHLAAGYLNLARLDLDHPAGEATAAREQALALYRRVLTFDPVNAEANIRSAEVLLAKGDAASAKRRIAATSPAAQQTARAQAVGCGAEAALGDEMEATSRTSALATDPALTEDDVRAALPGLRAGRRADLLEQLLDASATHHPLSPEGLRLLGLAQEAQAKLTAARTTLEQAFTADPAAVNTLADLSRIASAQGNKQDALGYLAHARALAPRDATLPFQFGVICSEMDLLGEAQKALGEALALQPNDPQYLLAMAKVTMLSQDPLKSAPYLEHYRQLKPSDLTGQLLTGAMYFRAKDFNAATPWLSKAADGSATQASANLYLGSIARQEHELEKALTFLQASAKGQPEDAQTHAELGETFLQLKRYSEAEAELDRAVALDPDSYVANFGLVQLYAHNDDPRRKAQTARFEEVKDRRDREMQQAMRVIEVRPEADPLPRE